MSNQVSNNPLNIPEILENIFSYLPTETLVRLTYVNKLWRIEARHKLYQNRTEIIYKSLKWFLNECRLNGEMPPVLRFQCTQSVIKVTKFRLAFNIDLRTELLAIRNKLEVQLKVAEAKYTDGENNLLKAQKEFRADPWNIGKYSLYRLLEREGRELYFNEQSAYKELANFEYFLVQYNYIVDHDEKVRIEKNIALLRVGEIGRYLSDQVTDILEYWDDSDPDDV
jgi:hypothetical protein